MDYYDLIEYLDERAWFEKMLFRIPITSMIELFVTLAVVTKSSAVNVDRVRAALFESLIKTMIGVWIMTSTTSLYFCL